VFLLILSCAYSPLLEKQKSKIQKIKSQEKRTRLTAMADENNKPMCATLKEKRDEFIALHQLCLALRETVEKQAVEIGSKDQKIHELLSQQQALLNSHGDLMDAKSQVCID
jgi:hypothetical protein